MAAAAILSVTLMPVLMVLFVRGRIVPAHRNPVNQLRYLRRYAGTRFYAPETKTYVSADDVERFLMEGQRVSIRDAETGQDVTDEFLIHPKH